MFSAHAWVGEGEISNSESKVGSGFCTQSRQLQVGPTLSLALGVKRRARNAYQVTLPADYSSANGKAVTPGPRGSKISPACTTYPGIALSPRSFWNVLIHEFSRALGMDAHVFALDEVPLPRVKRTHRSPTSYTIVRFERHEDIDVLWRNCR